jgi:hypothetical protein
MIRTETFLINKQGYGDEPVFTLGHKITRIEQARAYNWYGAMCDIEDGRQYLISYLESEKRIKEANAVKNVNKNYLPLTICWIARMMSNGIILPESSVDFFNNRLAAVVNSHVDVTESSGDGFGDRRSVQDHIRSKVAYFCESIWDRIDDGDEFSIYELLQKNDIPSKYTSQIREKFSVVRDEYWGALNKTDPQLVEGYSKYSTKHLKQWVQFYDDLLEEIDRYGGNTKKTRKPRKKRAASIDKKLKLFKYKVKDDDFQVASCGPAGIIGAQEVWLFNCSNKQITVLRAIDRGGLDIKRSTIINYDISTSITKKTGRKTNDLIKTILEGGKMQLRKLFDSIDSAALEPSDRSNENTIILRIVKS